MDCGPWKSNHADQVNQESQSALDWIPELLPELRDCQLGVPD